MYRRRRFVIQILNDINCEKINIIGHCNIIRTIASGGPLMKTIVGLKGTQVVQKYVQFGIISYNECGVQGLPSVYVNVLYHMPWILDHL